MAQFPWTDENIATLKRLWVGGHTCTQIAKRMGGGLTRNAIIGKVRRLGLSYRSGPNGSGFEGVNRARKVAKLHQKKSTFGAKSHSRQKRAPGTMPPATHPGSPALDLPSENTKRVSLFETGDSKCKWPLWGDGDDHRDCCGLPVKTGPYCAHHMQIAYAKPDKTGRAKSGFRFAARGSLPVLSKGGA